jgi:F-type H+-transporting ATPase subunit delta
MVAEGQRQLRVLRNIQEVSVTTAVPLTDELRSRILAQVAQVHKGEVEMKELVDPDILGGYVLQLGDQMIDASVKRQMKALGRELTEHDYEPEL